MIEPNPWPRSWTIAVGIALAVAIAVALIDHSRSRSANASTLHPVSGVLLVNGQRASEAMIALHPLSSTKNAECRHVAMTRADGTFQIMTIRPGDGAPVGDYAVTVIWPDSRQLDFDECTDVLTHDRLKGGYATASSTPLRVTITEGNNELTLSAVTFGGWSEPRRRDLENK